MTAPATPALDRLRRMCLRHDDDVTTLVSNRDGTLLDLVEVRDAYASDLDAAVLAAKNEERMSCRLELHAKLKSAMASVGPAPKALDGRIDESPEDAAIRAYEAHRVALLAELHSLMAWLHRKERDAQPATEDAAAYAADLDAAVLAAKAEERKACFEAIGEELSRLSTQYGIESFISHAASIYARAKAEEVKL